MDVADIVEAEIELDVGPIEGEAQLVIEVVVEGVLSTLMRQRLLTKMVAIMHHQ